MSDDPSDDEAPGIEIGPIESLEDLEKLAAPLFAPRPLSIAVAPAPYPIEALGRFLAPAAKAIAAKVQCPLVMAAQSVLATSSLVAQGLADVVMPFGQARPLSLYVVTVGATGDRKTTCDEEAKAPVRKREEKLRADYDVALDAYQTAAKAHRGQSMAIERASFSKMTREERAAEFRNLGPEPKPPLQPLLTIDEGTAEGLTKAMPEMPGALGIFSAEAAQFLNGHGFTADAKLRTAACYSAFWDGSGVRRLRVTSGVIYLPGRRVAAHLMIQPDAASDVLADPVLRNLGFLARFLIAFPDSIAGERLWKETDEDTKRALERYTERLLTLFDTPQVAKNTQGNELTPRQMPLSPEARKVWIAFSDDVEREQKRGRRYAELSDVAAKTAEQAARIAGVLTLVDRGPAVTIDDDAMRRGCDLARWYLDEALRLHKATDIPQEMADAQKLLDWCHEHGLATIEAGRILNAGPNPLRRKERMDEAVAVLVEFRWFTPDPAAKGKARQWLVTPEAG